MEQWQKVEEILRQVSIILSLAAVLAYRFDSFFNKIKYYVKMKTFIAFRAFIAALGLGKRINGLSMVEVMMICNTVIECVVEQLNQLDDKKKIDLNTKIVKDEDIAHADNGEKTASAKRV